MNKITVVLILMLFIYGSVVSADDAPSLRPAEDITSQFEETENVGELEETGDVEDINSTQSGLNPKKPETKADYTQEEIVEIYRNLEVPTFRYVHDLDPEEAVDTQNASWSPYSLFRLTAPLHFKTITVPPGYYLLTPRQHNGDWYMLFKVAGKVRYIVPIFDKKMVPMDFYKDHLPEEKTTWSQKQHLRLLKFVGKFQSSQRPEIPKTYLEAEDLDDNFILIILYWGDYKYYMVMRSIAM